MKIFRTNAWALHREPADRSRHQLRTEKLQSRHIFLGHCISDSVNHVTPRTASSSEVPLICSFLEVHDVGRRCRLSTARWSRGDGEAKSTN